MSLTHSPSEPMVLLDSGAAVSVVMSYTPTGVVVANVVTSVHGRREGGLYKLSLCDLVAADVLTYPSALVRSDYLALTSDELHH